MQLLHTTAYTHFLSFGKPLYRVMLALVQTIANTILYRSFSRWTAVCCCCCCIADKQHTNFMTNCFYFCVLWVIWLVSNIQHSHLSLTLSAKQIHTLHMSAFDFLYCGYFGMLVVLRLAAFFLCLFLHFDFPAFLFC